MCSLVGEVDLDVCFSFRGEHQSIGFGSAEVGALPLTGFVGYLQVHLD